ncbi:N-acyl-D-amino-acid deacylase family protein [Pseudonocardia endophytica]|uniref:N-acyl-D-aspartate/D-glutamate deacylase n=1 Tax=Pseudonocardia endophytica TaxID=401976 RepID=A0A4R1HLI1_PSEEN|nr:amidohydrolase family protein [Pseudonocardia endophytica]TCK22838.1 N-acyl-D-aspartate/D-glutamate deacylase [Pseudonocardia endophytica]
MAAHDVVVRGGSVVDGNGGPPVTADVALDGDRIVEVGRVSGTGRREIDAAGAVVAPGFVDIHTHYDGQATWESRLQPSSWHGVTTVVAGNCGVGFAPARPEHHDRLIELMEGVEDIPGVALHEGLAWNWESFDEFLSALEALPHDVDLATQVPHAALRVHTMGERAAAHEPATPDEIAAMASLARRGIEAGALGFSTSRTLNHRSIDGELTPSYDAGADELVAIASAVGETGRGVLQLVSDFPDPEAEFALLRRMAGASGRPLSFSLLQFPEDHSKHKLLLSLMESAAADGLTIRGQVAARPVGMLMGLANTLNPFMTNPVWRGHCDGLAPSEQAARMRDPQVREEVLAAQTREKDRSRLGGHMIHKYHLMYELGDPPDYEPPPSSALTERAARAGVEPAEIAYDVVAAGGMLYVTFANYAHGNLDDVHEMLVHPLTVPGLSDGGAHVGTICDGSFPTTLVQHWCRDRDGARLDLPFVVQRQARDTARAVGLLDRGVLAPGYRADLTVIDLDAMRLHAPEMHQDLPAGGRRLQQRVTGYRHTLVAGQETYVDGEPTDALPGRLLRGPRRAPA